MLGYLTTQTFETFLARQPGVSSIVLSNYRVRNDVLSLVPREFAASRQVLPIDRLGKLLTVGMACPLDRDTIEELQVHTGLGFEPMLCSPDCISAAVARHYRSEDEFAVPVVGRRDLYRLQQTK